MAGSWINVFYIRTQPGFLLLGLRKDNSLGKYWTNEVSESKNMFIYRTCSRVFYYWGLGISHSLANYLGFPVKNRRKHCYFTHFSMISLHFRWKTEDNWPNPIKNTTFIGSFHQKSKIILKNTRFNSVHFSPKKQDLVKNHRFIFNPFHTILVKNSRCCWWFHSLI